MDSSNTPNTEEKTTPSTNINGKNENKIITTSTTTTVDQKSKDKLTKTTSDKKDDNDTVPKVPEGWERCQAYNERKRRFCRQSICPRVPTTTNKENDGKDDKIVTPIYCGNHWHLYNTAVINTSNQKAKTNATRTEGRKGKRIPCPLDPSHTIYESTLQKHLKICPVTKLTQDQKKQIYYRYNVNTGGHGFVADYCKQCNDQKSEKKKKVKRAELLVWRILAAYCTLFRPPTESPTTPFTKTFLQSITYQELYHFIPTKDLSSKNNSPKEKQHIITSNTLNKYKIKVGGAKHLYQIQSILSHMLLRLSRNKSEMKSKEKDKKRVVLEMGAGRGMLGLIVAGVLQQQKQHKEKDENVEFIMVERAGSRAKADTVLRQAQKRMKQEEEEECSMALKRVELTRIKCDLSHVYLPFAFSHPPEQLIVSASTKPTVDSSGDTTITTETNKYNTRTSAPSSAISPPSVTVIAKHLCGAGTDLALKSLQPLLSPSTEITKTTDIDSIVMSTCCHGLCSYEHYVGRDYLYDCLKHASVDVEREYDEVFEFGQVEFDLMKRWSAGSTMGFKKTNSKSNKDDDDVSGDHTVTTSLVNNGQNNAKQHKKRRRDIEADDDNEEEEHFTPCTKDEKEDPYSVTSIVKSLNLSCGSKGLGRACQRLFDYGRKCYIEDVLFGNNGDEKDTAILEKEGKRRMQVEMFHYVEEDVTPQNALLLASRIK